MRISDTATAKHAPFQQVHNDVRGKGEPGFMLLGLPVRRNAGIPFENFALPWTTRVRIGLHRACAIGNLSANRAVAGLRISPITGATFVGCRL